MDRRTCMTEVWDEITKFNDMHFAGWREGNPVYYSNALAGEVGEVCNIVKHRDGGGTKNVHPTDLELLEELADVFIYLHMLVESVSEGAHDITSFAGAIRSKLAICSTRMEQNKK